MPIYAFACAACGHHFDRLQKLSDPDPSKCPECGADQVKRQLTAPSFRLSGSGWYETDFKKDGDRKRNLTEKAEGASAGDSAKSEGKGDAKPAEAKPADVKPTNAKNADGKAAVQPAKSAPAPATKPAAGTP